MIYCSCKTGTRAGAAGRLGGWAWQLQLKFPPCHKFTTFGCKNNRKTKSENSYAKGVNRRVDREREEGYGV